MRRTHPLLHCTTIHSSWAADRFARKSRWFTLAWALSATFRRTFTLVAIIIVLVRSGLHTMQVWFLWSDIWDLGGGPLTIPGSSLLNRRSVVWVRHSLRNAVLYSDAFNPSTSLVRTHKLFLINICLLLVIVFTICTMSLLFWLLSRFILVRRFRFCISSPHFMFLYCLILLYFSL